MTAQALRSDAYRTAARPRGFKPPRAAARAAATLLAVVISVSAWWLLAPPSLGGETSVAIVDGTSMLPHFQRDDLVLIRPSSHYVVGDVVAYRSHLLHRVVLHRIVKISHGRYTFKGDNNSWTDPEQPTRRDLIGKRWIRIGVAGRLASALKSPLVAASVAFLFVLAFGLSGRPSRKSTES